MTQTIFFEGGYARVIKDSITADGNRCTTLQCEIWRAVLAELNTHRVIAGRNADDALEDLDEWGTNVQEEFSRNSASSRAIPLRKQLAKVDEDPRGPIIFPAEQKGMQGGEPLAGLAYREAESEWVAASRDATYRASRLGEKGVHKSVANRLLEPFLPHTVVLTATNWDGFWAQRCNPAAQPEIRVAAEAMKAAMDASTPALLHDGQWHLPYIEREDIEHAEQWCLAEYGQGNYGKRHVTATLVKMSTARCARTSYETMDGVRSVQEDLGLYTKLTSATPAHWSPLEHPAAAWGFNSVTDVLPFTDLNGVLQRRVVTRPRVGNLLGFRQHRFEMEST